MPALLTTASTLMCPHGGTIMAAPGGAPKASAGGAAILRASDSFSIAGCAFNVSGVAQPCTSVQWVVTAQQVRHAGDFVLTSASVGLCLGPAPQGTVLVQSTQPQVSGL
jgi:hypothetical protein